MADNMEQPTLEDKKLKHPLLVIILVFLGIIVFLPFHGFFILLMKIGITVAVITFVKRTNDKQRIQDEFKKNNFEEVLQNIFPESQYFPKGENIDADGIRDCNLFRIDKKRYYSQDGLKLCLGNNNDIALDYVEVRTYEIKTDSDGDSYEATIFKGAVFKYTFFKKFKDNLYIIPNETEGGKVKHGLFGGNKPVFNPKKYDKNLRESQLEDVEFNEIFSVYSANEAETFYILTPQYMNLIKDLYKKYNAAIRFKFSDNNMYIAIEGMDLFNYKIEYQDFTHVDMERTLEGCVRQTKEELNSLAKFAETLELGNSIFY